MKMRATQILPWAYKACQISAMSLYSLSAELLEKLSMSVVATMVGYDPRLVKLYPKDFLARYNRITVDLKNLSEHSFDLIFVTVHREGSKIGDDNYYVVPLHVPELTAHSKCRCDFLSFDSFNLPFKNIRINLTTSAESSKRQVSRAYVERSRDLTKIIE